jgi:hypothetical protein
MNTDLYFLCRDNTPTTSTPHYQWLNNPDNGFMINTDICLLKVPCSVASSLQAFTATPRKKARPLGDLSRPSFFFHHCHIHSHISGFFSCHFYSFSTQILLLLAFLLLRLCLLLLVFPCLKLAFRFLLGSLLLPTSQPLLAVLLLLVCHKLVSDCMAHSHFHGHQFSTDIQLLNLPHFCKVAVTTAICHRCYMCNLRCQQKMDNFNL